MKQMRNNMDVLMLKDLNTNPAQSALQEHQLCTWSPFEFARKTTADAGAGSGAGAIYCCYGCYLLLLPTVATFALLSSIKTN